MGKIKKNNVSCIQTRYILTLMTFCGMALVFAHRVCLGVAIVAMVNHTALESIDDGNLIASNECPDVYGSTNATRKYKEGQYDWSPRIQGLILGAYFYGYVSSMFIAGRIAEHVGPKWLIGGAIFIASVITLLTPFLSTLGVIVMIVTRVILGLFQGFIYPALYTLFARWAPAPERSTMLSMSVFGSHFGSVLFLPLTGYLCENGFADGWPSAFYTLGTLGVIWFLFWIFLVFNTPNQHPRISVKELHYIQDNIENISKDTKARPVPWGKVLTSAPFWAVTLSKFCGAWSFISLQTKLPAYLEDVMHFPMQQNGFLSALPSAALCISITTSGYASDVILNRKWLGRTTTRKLFEVVALTCAAACVGGVTQIGCNAILAVALLTLMMASFGIVGGGEVPLFVEMAPDFSGSVFGISNAFACLSGILSPYVAGIFLEGNHGSPQQWNNVFYTCVGLFLFGAIVFLLFASAEVQPWAFVDEKNSITNDMNSAQSVSVIDINAASLEKPIKGSKT